MKAEPSNHGVPVNNPLPADSPQEGCDQKGPLTGGNPGRPGNPFARKVASMRAAMMRAVSEQDLEEITKQVIAKAQQGDLGAARLLYSYVLGKPAATVNPDRVDQDEWQLSETRPKPEEVAASLKRSPYKIINAATRGLDYGRSKEFGEQLHAVNAAEAAGLDPAVVLAQVLQAAENREGPQRDKQTWPPVPASAYGSGAGFSRSDPVSKRESG